MGGRSLLIKEARSREIRLIVCAALSATLKWKLSKEGRFEHKNKINYEFPPFFWVDGGGARLPTLSH